MICIQCAMRALLDGKPAPVFPDDPVEHMRQYHPDPAKTAQERHLMEIELHRRLEAENNAPNN